MFEDHLRQSEAAQDAYLGSRCTLTPQRAGEYTLAADPDRAVVQFIGTLAQAPDVKAMHSKQGQDTGLRRAHSSDELSVSSVEAAKLPYRPEKDDLIEARGQRFHVTVALPGPDGGLQILMSEVD